MQQRTRNTAVSNPFTSDKYMRFGSNDKHGDTDVTENVGLYDIFCESTINIVYHYLVETCSW